MPMETIKLLRAIPLFSEISDGVLEKIARYSLRRFFRKHTTVWQKGDDNNGLYVLISGMVKAVEYTQDGKEFILNIMVPADCMGEMSLLDRKPHSADLVTMEESDFLIIPPETFFSISKEHPELISSLTHNVAERLRALSERASVLKYTDVYGRVCKLIAHLLSRRGSSKDHVSLTHEEIGNLIGATRSNVTRALKEMQNQGLVKVERNKISVLEKFKETVSAER